MVEKGSVTLDGTSLTITAVAPIDASETWIEVVLIPHTLENTVFGTKNEGDTLNIEVDVIAKYVERMTGLDR
jgi:riboflavin synthase alpha subunit